MVGLGFHHTSVQGRDSALHTFAEGLCESVVCTVPSSEPLFCPGPASVRPLPAALSLRSLYQGHASPGPLVVLVGPEDACSGWLLAQPLHRSLERGISSLPWFSRASLAALSQSLRMPPCPLTSEVKGLGLSLGAPPWRGQGQE